MEVAAVPGARHHRERRRLLDPTGAGGPRGPRLPCRGGAAADPVCVEGRRGPRPSLPRGVARRPSLSRCPARSRRSSSTVGIWAAEPRSGPTPPLCCPRTMPSGSPMALLFGDLGRGGMDVLAEDLDGRQDEWPGRAAPCPRSMGCWQLVDLWLQDGASGRATVSDTAEEGLPAARSRSGCEGHRMNDTMTGTVSCLMRHFRWRWQHLPICEGLTATWRRRMRQFLMTGDKALLLQSSSRRRYALAQRRITSRSCTTTCRS